MQNAHIIQLSPEVIGQIAAGEVVERPSAAIKELAENSMDAGATAITVEIRDGGLTSFRVVDNGSGIQPSDIRMAFARHATSKIRSTEDLYGVRTLGFRGEALASIAAVAKVNCTTRVKGAEYGISARCDGGEIGEIKEAACPEGTSFTVREIFYNAPVRRKFLKKPSTETSYISDLMMRMILSHPQISFRYIADGKTVYFSPGDGKLERAILSIYGLSVLNQLHRVSGNMNGLILDGYIGVGDLARGNRTHQSFILNGRLIKSDLLSAALEDGCRQRVMIGRHPICILHLTMPYENADVNVHPNKWEVRFQNESDIRQAVQALVSDSLQSDKTLDSAPKLFPDNILQRPTTVTTVKRADSSADSNGCENEACKPSSSVINPVSVYNIPNSATEQRHLTARQKADPPSESFRNAFTPNSYAGPTGSRQSSEIRPRMPSAEKKSDPAVYTISCEPTDVPSLQDTIDDIPVRLIGSVFDTYIILETEDKMLLCDQHAVHERLLYEKFMKEYSSSAVSQPFLVPITMQLTHREYQVYLDSVSALQKAGFEADDFGNMTVQLRSVPMILGQARSAECFRDALDELAESGRLSDQKRMDKIIQMACKHAVKGGERAPMEALMDLVRQMIREDVTPTCPHGRPLIIEVTKKDLEKRFHRIQG